ncbi:efflux transporter outer membrane subunit [Aurantiacibacter zhengii]|uniref:Efflux transporter outer membrane subunit n=1 Tax=Aurantiacibacter zhengii TaxID=2307003 RepID=A0A418NQX5_9SPHN|nr:efflux transporter outer membrane subunit [Aurantiacibacter zhengii]RIV85098.1 efflux transporter outer membrane subunit [Aurantiacibacter zhengii]
MMRRVLIPISGALALSACATTTVPQAPGPADVAMPGQFAADYRPPLDTDGNWWEGFGDPRLDELVERALAANLDIATTRERLASSRALLRAARGDRLPSVDGVADVGIDATSNDIGVTLSPGAVALFDPDISGRLSAQIEAAAARVAAAEYLVADRERLVAAEVAQQYIELRRTGERLLLLRESTRLQEQTLRIVTLRFEAGLSANLDVRRAAADLAQTRAQSGLLELQRARAAHALAVLTGDVPRQAPPVDQESGSVPAFTAGPALGVPADLLRRRPDLLVAEADLMEAAANVGIERADLRPSLTISGQVLLGDGSFGGIVSDFLGSLGAALDLPMFDGGRRRAEINAAQYELQARFLEYRQGVLGVMGEVENALVAIEAYSNRNADLEQAITESERAFEQSNALYREGLASLFDVLDSQRQLISSRQALIDSEAALAASFVDLYAAVGMPSAASRTVRVDVEGMDAPQGFEP